MSVKKKDLSLLVPGIVCLLLGIGMLYSTITRKYYSHTVNEKGNIEYTVYPFHPLGGILGIPFGGYLLYQANKKDK